MHIRRIVFKLFEGQIEADLLDWVWGSIVRCRTHFDLCDVDTFCIFHFFCEKCVLNIGLRMQNGGEWRYMGAYECVTDAYVCVTDAYEHIRMHIDASRFILGTRYWVLGPRYRVLGTRCQTSGTGYQVLGTRCCVQGTRYQVQGARKWVEGTKYCHD